MLIEPQEIFEYKRKSNYVAEGERELEQRQGMEIVEGLAEAGRVTKARKSNGEKLF